MEALFTALTRAVAGTPVLALSASVAWGILSILLSPCHLSSIPLIVGFIGEQADLTRRRAFAISVVFAVGILVTIAAIGGITAALGRMMGDLGGYGNYLVAVIFFLVGLHLVGVIPLPWSGTGQMGTKQRGLLAGFLLGLIFGLALGPCTFAYMAPMLGVTLQVARTSPAYAVALLLAFGIGHCSVIVAAGTSTQAVQHYLQWSDKSRALDALKKVCGVLVILGGLYLIYTAR